MVGATLRDSGLWSREQRAEGCESGLYGTTESPRREGSARPGKVKADFPEKGEVSQSLSGGTRIQWKATEGSESILVHIAWIAHIGLGSVIELFFELWNVASAPGFATNCDKIRTSFAEWVISSCGMETYSHPTSHFLIGSVWKLNDIMNKTAIWKNSLI